MRRTGNLESNRGQKCLTGPPPASRVMPLGARWSNGYYARFGGIVPISPSASRRRATNEVGAVREPPLRPILGRLVRRTGSEGLTSTGRGSDCCRPHAARSAGHRAIWRLLRASHRSRLDRVHGIGYRALHWILRALRRNRSIVTFRYWETLGQRSAGGSRTAPTPNARAPCEANRVGGG